VGEQPGSVAVVGLHGGEWFGAAAAAALARATVLVGAARHLAGLPQGLRGERVELSGDLGRVLEEAEAARSRGEQVCLVVSGDPGFFGLARLARARLGSEGLTVHPAPSSVALACARAGLSWDDAVVVSAHGRAPQLALEAVPAHPKVAILTSPACPPEWLGRMLVTQGCPRRYITVVSRLGETDERVWAGGLEELAANRFDPLSVVVCVAPDPSSLADDGPAWVWGLPEAAYRHRDGMITKSEVRSVALGKLRLPGAGVLWDVGAGSGSIAAECTRLAPGLRVFAIERSPDEAVRLQANLAASAATVIVGQAPEALAALPDPDRVFVGGGGLDVLAAVIERLRPGGTVVATYAAVDRAAAAATALGHLVQISVSRAVPIGSTTSVRLQADNPVFVCWGPTE
jgi:precorrin-6Y C5,15-methyltransferase (decarboxylating)